MSSIFCFVSDLLLLIASNDICCSCYWQKCTWYHNQIYTHIYTHISIPTCDCSFLSTDLSLLLSRSKISLSLCPVLFTRFNNICCSCYWQKCTWYHNQIYTHTHISIPTCDCSFLSADLSLLSSWSKIFCAIFPDLLTRFLRACTRRACTIFITACTIKEHV